MKKLFLVLAFIIVASATMQIYAWKRFIDTRAYYAELAGAYLFNPSGVIDAKGRELSRQQLLDSYLHLQVDAHPEWGLRFSSGK